MLIEEKTYGRLVNFVKATIALHRGGPWMPEDGTEFLRLLDLRDRSASTRTLCDAGRILLKQLGES